jgi:RNA polymerase sigma-70 factor (ECF subfamily)
MGEGDHASDRLVGAVISLEQPLAAAPAVSEPDDLIARAAGGDRAAFRGIYQRHRADVARLVYRMLGGSSDVDDVVQEVFFQVHRSLKDFRGQSKFTTWLHRVTVNVVLMHRRAARSRPAFTEEAPPDLTPDDDVLAPDEDADRRARIRVFANLLERLADKKRIVFVLHDLEGVSPQEISKIVDAPVLTVRTRLFYARRELEALIAEEPALAGLRATFAREKSSGASASPGEGEGADA